jgi:glycosyltransferase involved in cell wall biosynthesis
MKVLLVGNYENDNQRSMRQFADLLAQALRQAGCEVRTGRPTPVVGRLRPGAGGVGKYLGYVDKFLLFPLRLRREARWADVVHICDHSNAMYVADTGGKPSTVTCHDLIAVCAALGHYPGQTVKATGRLQQRWILTSLAKAKRVMCISEATETMLQQLAPGTDAAVIHNALPYPFHPLAAEEVAAVMQRHGMANQRFVLHVGANHWYKNRLGVLHIFAEQKKLAGNAALHLVMVGEPFTQAMRDYVASAQLQPCVHELVGVPVAELNALYCAAELLLFPSLEEGFGWPIAEAQAAGCLVATTNRPPMSEAAGGAAILIDPAEPAQAAAAMQSRLQDRQTLVQLGLQHAAQFTVERMGEEYLRQLLIACENSHFGIDPAANT